MVLVFKLLYYHNGSGYTLQKKKIILISSVYPTYSPRVGQSGLVGQRESLINM